MHNHINLRSLNFSVLTNTQIYLKKNYKCHRNRIFTWWFLNTWETSNVFFSSSVISLFDFELFGCLTFNTVKILWFFLLILIVSEGGSSLLNEILCLRNSQLFRGSQWQFQNCFLKIEEATRSIKIERALEAIRGCRRDIERLCVALLINSAT